MWFGIHLVRKNVITADEFVDVLAHQLASRAPIGKLAVQAGHLTMKQVFEILARQVDTQEPFGEIAISLGFMTRQDLAGLLLVQSESMMSVPDVLESLKILDRKRIEREQALFQDSRADRSSAAPSPAKPARGGDTKRPPRKKRTAKRTSKPCR